MNLSLRSTAIANAAFIALLGCVAGCQHNDTATTVPVATPVAPALRTQMIDEQIAKINADPKIPPQVKASLISNLRGPGAPTQKSP